MCWTHAQQLAGDATFWPVPAPTGRPLLNVVRAMAFGYSDLDPAYKVATAVFGLAALGGAALAWRANRRAAGLLVLWLLGPLLPIALLSLFFGTTHSYDLLLPVAMPLYIVIATGLTRFHPRVTGVIATAAFAVIAGLSLSTLCRDGQTHPPASALGQFHVRSHSLPLSDEGMLARSRRR